MNDLMDDLSDETARRRVFRGVHRALKPIDDPSDSPQPEPDALPTSAMDALDDPYGGSVGAEDHETYDNDFVRPSDYPDEDADPYSDTAPRRHAPDALNRRATGPFIPDAGRDDAHSASGVNLDTLLSRNARQAAYAGLNPTAARLAPLVPLPGVPDDALGPSPVFGSRTPVADPIDTLAGDSMQGGASLQPARRDPLTVPDIGNLPVYRFPGETNGSQGSNRLGVAIPLPSDRTSGSIPEPHRADDDGTIDRSNRASGLAGGPAWQPASAQSPPDVRSSEPSFTLHYDIETRDPATAGPPCDLDSARVESESADWGHDPAVGHPDAKADAEGHDLDGSVREPETPEPASARAMRPLADVSKLRAELPRSDASDDEPSPARDAGASNHSKMPRLAWTACAAAIAPIVAIVALLYTQPDLLRRLEDLAGRPHLGAAPRASTRSETEVNLGRGAPAVSSTASPLAETPPAGKAPPPSPEIEAQLKGADVGLPRLANYPPPVPTATPSASGLEREAGASPAPTTEVAPAADTTPLRGPNSPPLPTFAPSDGKAGSGESTRSAATQVPEAAPTPPSPDAGVPISRARRSPARHNRTGATASDDALSAKADRLLATGDILAARTLFQSLVTVGDPRGARGVAQTFDSQVLDRYPASGVVPDQAEAARWRAIAARLESRQRRNQGEAPQ